MKNRRKPIQKKVRICSREWILESDPRRKNGGAEFNTYGKDGLGHIKIGTFRQNKRYILEVIMHEVIESILSYDEKRWKESKDNGKILFSFDHNYLEGFCPKLIDALVSCGVIDPNKKIL